VKLYVGGRPTFFVYFFTFFFRLKTWSFYVFWVVAHVFSNTAVNLYSQHYSISQPASILKLRSQHMKWTEPNWPETDPVQWPTAAWRKASDRLMSSTGQHSSHAVLVGVTVDDRPTVDRHGIRVVHGSILCDPTQPNPMQVKKFGPNPSQPNTNCHCLTLSLYYSFWSVSGSCQIGHKI